MGLSGRSIAWRVAAGRFGAPAGIVDAVAVIAVGAFVAVSIGYLIKCIAAPNGVRAEFRHPIAGNLFGTIPISLLLLPIVLAPVALRFAQAMWIGGAASIWASRGL